MKLQAASRLQADQSTGLGAGVLFICTDTRRMLFVKRSPECDEPGTWCCLGGGVDPGETIEQGLRREVREEAGYTQDFTPVLFDVSRQPGFTYHNFYAFVDKEFVPVLNDEHTAYKWCDKLPKPCHPKLLESIRRYQRGGDGA